MNKLSFRELLKIIFKLGSQNNNLRSRSRVTSLSLAAHVFLLGITCLFPQQSLARVSLYSCKIEDILTIQQGQLKPMLELFGKTPVITQFRGKIFFIDRDSGEVYGLPFGLSLIFEAQVPDWKISILDKGGFGNSFKALAVQQQLYGNGTSSTYIEVIDYMPDEKPSFFMYHNATVLTGTCE